MAPAERAARRRPSRRPSGALIARLRTPLAVQRFLNALPYNTEPPPGRATLRSFRGVVRHRHGALPGSGARRRRDPRAARLSPARPQLRIDRRARSRDLRLSPERPVGIGRAIARSRAARAQGGLRDATRARAQLRRSVRRLHGRVTGYAVVDLRTLGDYDWRLSERNVWKVERVLLDYPHRPIRAPTSASIACAGATSSTANASAASRSTTGVWSGGRSCLRSSER